MPELPLRELVFIDYHSSLFFLVGYPLLLLAAYLFTWKIKSVETVNRIYRIMIFLVGLWVTRALLDFYWGISFLGNAMDAIITNYGPVLITWTFVMLYKTPLFGSFKWRFAGLLPFLYWALFIPLVFFAMYIDHPLLGGNNDLKVRYDGQYYRIEQGGQWMTMSDQFNGTQMRVYHKYKYFLIEKEVRTQPAYQIDTLLNIQESSKELKFDVKFNGIKDTLRGWVAR